MKKQYPISFKNTLNNKSQLKLRDVVLILIPMLKSLSMSKQKNIRINYILIEWMESY